MLLYANARTDVNLVAEFVTPTKPDPAPETYKLIVSYAKITLKDGSAVADLKAVQSSRPPQTRTPRPECSRTGTAPVWS